MIFSPIQTHFSIIFFVNLSISDDLKTTPWRNDTKNDHPKLMKVL